MAAANLTAVTGATGQIGARVAAALTAAGAPQRLLVRDAGRAPRLEGAEVRRIGSYGAADDVFEALAGVHTLFLVPAAEAPDRVAQHGTVIEAARTAGVARIVYLSFLGADAGSTFTLARDHFETEQLVRATGLPFTFLRMNLYMDFIPSMVGEDGVIRGPAGDGRLSAVLRADVADAAAALLLASADGDEHVGQTYDLTGPESFSLAEAAQRMTELTGRQVRFQDETLEEARASRARFGAPAWEVEGWISSYRAIASGELDVRSDDVERLTGRPPTSLEQYLAAAR